MLAAVMLPAGGGERASDGRVEISGETLTVTGSGGPDNPRFTYYTSAGPGYTRIFDDGGVLDPLSVDCDRPDVDPIPQDPSKVAICEDVPDVMSRALGEIDRGGIS